MSRRTAVVVAVAALVAAAIGTALVLSSRRTGVVLPPQVRRRVPAPEPGHVEEDVTGRPTPRSVTALSTPPHVEQSPEAAVED